MISIAIYSDLEEHINELKSLIQDYSIENKVMARISVFSDSYNFITVPHRFDIYIMDMESKDDVTALGKQRMGIDDNGHFIYLSNDTTKAYLATKTVSDGIATILFNSNNGFFQCKAFTGDGKTYLSSDGTYKEMDFEWEYL